MPTLIIESDDDNERIALEQSIASLGELRQAAVAGGAWTPLVDLGRWLVDQSGGACWARS